MSGWGQRRQHHKRLMSPSEWPSFVLLFSFLSFRKNHNRESAAVFVWLLIIQADGKSMSSACPPPPRTPPPPYSLPPPMLPFFLRPRSRPDVSVRTNKTLRRRNKKPSMALLRGLIRRLFTSEGEEPAGCQAAGGGGWGRGPPGTSLAAEEPPKQVDGVIYLFLLFLFLTELSNNAAAGSTTVGGIQSTDKVLIGALG